MTFTAEHAEKAETQDFSQHSLEIFERLQSPNAETARRNVAEVEEKVKRAGKK